MVPCGTVAFYGQCSATTNKPVFCENHAVRNTSTCANALDCSAETVPAPELNAQTTGYRLANSVDAACQRASRMRFVTETDVF